MFSKRDSIYESTRPKPMHKSCVYPLILFTIFLAILSTIYIILKNNKNIVSDASDLIGHLKTQIVTLTYYLDNPNSNIHPTLPHNTSCTSPSDDPYVQSLRTELDRLSTQNKLIEERIAKAHPKNQAFIDYQLKVYLLKSNSIAIEDIDEYFRSVRLAPPASLKAEQRDSGLVGRVFNNIKGVDLSDVMVNRDFNVVYRFVSNSSHSTIVFTVRKAFTLIAIRLTLPKVD